MTSLVINYENVTSMILYFYTCNAPFWLNINKIQNKLLWDGTLHKKTSMVALVRETDTVN